MIRHDMNDISDEEFDKVVNPCNEYIINYIKNNILNEFVAFDIATCYNMDAMWDEPFDTQIKTAVEDLSQLRFDDCDKSKIKSILKDTLYFYSYSANLFPLASVFMFPHKISIPSINPQRAAIPHVTMVRTI